MPISWLPSAPKLAATLARTVGITIIHTERGTQTRTAVPVVAARAAFTGTREREQHQCAPLLMEAENSHRHRCSAQTRHEYRTMLGWRARETASRAGGRIQGAPRRASVPGRSARVIDICRSGVTPLAYYTYFVVETHRHGATATANASSVCSFRAIIA